MSTTTTLRPSTNRVAATRRGTHLTFRGRVLVVLGLAALLCGAFAFGRSASEASETAVPASTPTLGQTTVEAGDTLWSVAQRIAPDSDPRPVVAQLRRLNELESAQLQVGQQLLLPAAA